MVRSEVKMRSIRLIQRFLSASFQEESIYRVNFFISLISSLLTLASSILGISVVFGQIEMVKGWTFASTLALLGIYLIVGAIRSLFISPGLESLAGMDGEIWTGKFDFLLLRPVNTQFLVTFRKWKVFSLFDLLLGTAVLSTAVSLLNAPLSAWQIVSFLIMFCCGVTILYSILLVFSALVFWSPGVLFTWIFNGLFQMARYPLSMYPTWLQLILTWVIPVGMITTIPTQALLGELTSQNMIGSIVLAIVFMFAASLFFRWALRHYSSASS